MKLTPSSPRFLRLHSGTTPTNNVSTTTVVAAFVVGLLALLIGLFIGWLISRRRRRREMLILKQAMLETDGGSEMTDRSSTLGSNISDYMDMDTENIGLQHILSMAQTYDVDDGSTVASDAGDENEGSDGVNSSPGVIDPNAFRTHGRQPTLVDAAQLGRGEVDKMNVSPGDAGSLDTSVSSRLSKRSFSDVFLNAFRRSFSFGSPDEGKGAEGYGQKGGINATPAKPDGGVSSDIKGSKSAPFLGTFSFGQHGSSFGFFGGNRSVSYDNSNSRIFKEKAGSRRGSAAAASSSKKDGIKLDDPIISPNLTAVAAATTVDGKTVDEDGQLFFSPLNNDLTPVNFKDGENAVVTSSHMIEESDDENGEGKEVDATEMSTKLKRGRSREAPVGATAVSPTKLMEEGGEVATDRSFEAPPREGDGIDALSEAPSTPKFAGGKGTRGSEKEYGGTTAKEGGKGQVTGENIAEEDFHVSANSVSPTKLMEEGRK